MKALLVMGCLSGMIDIKEETPEIRIPLFGGCKLAYMAEEMPTLEYDDTIARALVFKHYGQILGENLSQIDIIKYVCEGWE